MTTPPYRLIATDLDGTFLDSHAQVTPENAAAALVARAHGLTTIAVTARSARSTIAISKKGNLGPIAVCGNGAVGVTVDDGTVLWHETISQEEASTVIVGLRQLLPGILFALEKHVDFIPERSFLQNEGLIDRYRTVDNVLAEIAGGVTRIICRHPFVAQDRIVETIGTLEGVALSTIAGGVDWVEILPMGVDKGTGLRRACDYLGLPLETTVVIGDHLNDLPMFAIAGTAAAVGNAHLTTKARAHIHVASNDGHALADVVAILLGTDVEADPDSSPRT